MHRCILASLLVSASLLSAPVRAADYKIDPAHSSISFKVSHFLGRVSGRFGEFTGQVSFDAKNVAQAGASAEIRATSIDTGIAARDKHLRSAEFFDVEKFPTITFVAKKVVSTGDKSADVTGDLTLHGVTLPVTLATVYRGTFPDMTDPAKTRAAFEAHTKIDRREFGLTWGKMVEGVAAVGQEIEIELLVEAVSGS
jgi:polyisoprenoid-binding protein YceI